MIDGSRSTRTQISLNCKPSASPREISSRSGRVNITRTAGILSHRTTKIKCYDRLNSPISCTERERDPELTAGTKQRSRSTNGASFTEYLGAQQWQSGAEGREHVATNLANEATRVL